MKPASIIFLIVAILFCIGGYACMSIGKSRAAAEGIDLFAGTADEDSDYVYKYDFSEDEIGKIAVNLKEATVNIIGGSSKSYIELVNFAEGMYEFSSSNKILTVNNNSDFSQITDMASLIFNFKGLRSLVNYTQVRDRAKTVNIYVSDEQAIKIYECKLVTGNVKISGVTTQSDFNATVTTGDVTLENITNGSTANISLEAGDLTFDDCSVASIIIDQKKGDSELITTTADRLSVKIAEGDFRFGYRHDLEYVNLNLFTGVGSVTLNGVSQGGFYEVDELPTSAKFEVSVDKGDIMMNSNMTGENQSEN